MLRLEYKEWYKVKQGQTLREIAAAFCVAERTLVQVNGFTEEPRAGCIVKIPPTEGNVYTAKAGDTKTLLCGSEENFEKKNGTPYLYPGMRVIL